MLASSSSHVFNMLWRWMYLFEHFFILSKSKVTSVFSCQKFRGGNWQTFFLSAEKMDLKLVLHASVQNSSRQIVKWAHGVWKSQKKSHLTTLRAKRAPDKSSLKMTKMFKNWNWWGKCQNYKWDILCWFSNIVELWCPSANETTWYSVIKR